MCSGTSDDVPTLQNTGETRPLDPGTFTIVTANPWKTGEHGFRDKIRSKMRSTAQNLDEYRKQLMGGNGEVAGAVNKLETLVKNESLMMQAITTRNTQKISGIEVKIDGLNVEFRKVA
jgi:hypothetical protein